MGAFKRMSGGKRPKRLEPVTDAASMHANAYEMRQAAYGGIIASSSRTVYAIRKIVVGGFYEWNERRRMQRMKR
jgi:hypothetical protein